MRILIVCTGNICRSPLVEQVLRAKLNELPAAIAQQIHLSSAGTAAENGMKMPEPAANWSVQLGGDPSAHGSTYLSEAELQDVDFVLTMEREQRSRVVSLAPALLRRTFTLREIDRLMAEVSDAEIREEAHGPLVADAPAARLRAVLGLLADTRGFTTPPADPSTDDVIDPYRRSDATYALAAEQMVPGMNATLRLLTSKHLW